MYRVTRNDLGHNYIYIKVANFMHLYTMIFIYIYVNFSLGHHLGYACDPY